MEYNEQLLKTLVNETNLRNSNGEFKWITEYLGYLPFGQYQWIEINDKDMSTKFEWDKKDLEKLTELGLLVKISEEKDFDGYDKTIIKYRINWDLLKPVK